MACPAGLLDQLADASAEFFALSAADKLLAYLGTLASAGQAVLVGVAHPDKLSHLGRETHCAAEPGTPRTGQAGSRTQIIRLGAGNAAGDRPFVRPSGR